MFILTISDEDKQWLRDNYPALRIQGGSDGAVEIAGILSFSMAFLGEGKPYVINPAPDCSEGIQIQDKYQIRVELKKSNFSDLPQIYEADSRLINVAQIRNLRLLDLHINPSGAACLCIKPEESRNLPSGFNLRDFFQNLVIPFFYAQSYFEKNNSWPWGEYSHGELGLIEWYLRNQNQSSEVIRTFLDQLRRYDNFWRSLQPFLTSKRSFKGHMKCICGKNEKFRKCHPDIFRGLWKLKQEITLLKIPI